MIHNFVVILQERLPRIREDVVLGGRHRIGPPSDELFAVLDGEINDGHIDDAVLAAGHFGVAAVFVMLIEPADEASTSRDLVILDESNPIRGIAKLRDKKTAGILVCKKKDVQRADIAFFGSDTSCKGCVVRTFLRMLKCAALPNSRLSLVIGHHFGK